jgi:hypothetical protein
MYVETARQPSQRRGFFLFAGRQLWREIYSLLRIYFNLESVRWAFINISFQTFNQKNILMTKMQRMLMSLTWPCNARPFSRTLLP